MPGSMILDSAQSLTLRPAPPFDFAGTVFKPSHFPSSDAGYEAGIYRQTMRWGGEVLGLRLEDVGNATQPAVRLTVFAHTPLTADALAAVAAEVAHRFGLDRDLAPFHTALAGDELLGPVLARRGGMRVSAGVSLYEFPVTAVVLQNATVRRTVRMMEALFAAYGARAAYDGVELSAFWPPEALAAAPEEDLRALKVGYRAKTLRRQAAAFSSGEIDEAVLRTLTKDELKRRLLGLYGVGPASVSYLLFEVFHHYDALDYLPPWEQKIYSRLLFGEALVPPERILAEAGRCWGEWRMLAAHHLFEDLFWQHQAQPIPWLEELIRL